MRFIEFNGIRFTSGDDTPYIYNKFDPNAGDTSRQSENPLNYDGEMISNITYNPRVVNIQGHIWGNTVEELFKYKRELFNKCNGKTKAKLLYFDGKKQYQAAAIAEIPSCGDVEGLCISFNVNFTLYRFFWEDFYETQLLFDRKNEVTDKFTLPCVFTSRKLETTFQNKTDFAVYPVITIQALSAAENKTVKIKNLTTGEEISIDGYTFVSGEMITIDCENYSVQSDINGNILNQMNDFESWCLKAGANSVQCLNGGASVAIAIKFFVKYVGV